MEIKLNLPKNDDYISNLAFIKALLIKNTIEQLNISYEEKVSIKKEVLKNLNKTWTTVSQELQSPQKKENYYEE